MGLFDGYVSGRLPKGITIDSSLEDKLGGEHLTTTEDHNFYLSDYIAAVSKGVELHSELEHVKSIIQYKLNEIKTACETKETCNAGKRSDKIKFEIFESPFTGKLPVRLFKVIRYSGVSRVEDIVTVDPCA